MKIIAIALFYISAGLLFAEPNFKVTVKKIIVSDEDKKLIKKHSYSPGEFQLLSAALVRNKDNTFLQYPSALTGLNEKVQIDLRITNPQNKDSEMVGDRFNFSLNSLEDDAITLKATFYEATTKSLPEFKTDLMSHVSTESYNYDVKYSKEDIAKSYTRIVLIPHKGVFSITVKKQEE